MEHFMPQVSHPQVLYLLLTSANKENVSPLEKVYFTGSFRTEYMLIKYLQ